MSSPRVVRIARSDEATAFVLVHVCHTGPGALDLTLTATEGECPYSAILKQSLLKTLRVKNYQGTDEEWTRVICLVLGQSTGTEEPIPDGGIESFASIVGSGEEDKELVITIRKRVQAITQKLGAIVLRQDDEQAIELFEWANMSAARADALETRFIDLTNRHRTAEDTIQRLVEQLEGLMQTKSRHEHQLVANFTQVLNQKKLKIRNQQRLLASATSDPVKVSEIQAATWKRGGEGEALQQRTKRGVSDISNADDTGKGFEPMNVDEQKTKDSLIEQDIDEGGQSTPQSGGKTKTRLPTMSWTGWPIQHSLQRHLGGNRRRDIHLFKRPRHEDSCSSSSAIQ
ncbi:uncharacterized protein N7459_006734 [Penicillium hispanicum]|uniref:uncharacterized protein n=1 Tax=Penicillium hispanicum TaxID=1080232 RepID=UPI0025422874|nr:uncharacterized protein N7459_006734 [Penicillium hispanicum]KAJ5577770.1 hypothetical protein N7459_006734 [Penicillium hispanicum]